MFCQLYVLQKCWKVRHFGSSSAAWLNRHVKDHYVKQAVGENMRSRAAYKIQDIQKKHNIIRKNDFVMDLGSAPGGWSMSVSAMLDFEQGGKLFAVDLLPMDAVPGCHFVQGNFMSADVERELVAFANGRFANVIMSDMLHNTCGHKDTDHYRSVEMCYQIIDLVAHKYLGEGGSLVCKFLRGADDKELVAYGKEHFVNAKIVKPKSSRQESAECYLLATSKKKVRS